MPWFGVMVCRDFVQRMDWRMKRVSRAERPYSHTAVAEYALIASAIGLAMVVSLLGFGDKLATAFRDAAIILGG
jgi:Flp pilus assembly pilin Flp